MLENNTINFGKTDCDHLYNPENSDYPTIDRCMKCNNTKIKNEQDNIDYKFRNFNKKLIESHIECNKNLKILIGVNFMRDWISIKDRMPEQFDYVLVCYYVDTRQISNMSVAHWHGQMEGKPNWNLCFIYHCIPVNDKVTITHWMPLPDKPKD